MDAKTEFLSERYSLQGIFFRSYNYWKFQIPGTATRSSQMVYTLICPARNHYWLLVENRLRRATSSVHQRKRQDKFTERWASSAYVALTYLRDYDATHWIFFRSSCVSVRLRSIDITPIPNPSIQCQDTISNGDEFDVNRFFDPYAKQAMLNLNPDILLAATMTAGMLGTNSQLIRKFRIVLKNLATWPH